MNDLYCNSITTRSGGEYVDVYDLNTGFQRLLSATPLSGGVRSRASMCITPDGAANVHLGVGASYAPCWFHAQQRSGLCI